MKPLFVLLMAALLCTAGCKSLAPDSTTASPVSPGTLLEQADTKLVAADYPGAQALYAEFLNASPDNPQAPRARAMQTVLDRLLSSQTELDRVKRSDEVPRLRRELSERQNESERLKTEIAKLRADMERLRSIDLQTLPGTKK